MSLLFLAIVALVAVAAEVIIAGAVVALVYFLTRDKKSREVDDD
jgi:hypothetical protein